MALRAAQEGKKRVADDEDLDRPMKMMRVDGEGGAAAAAAGASAGATPYAAQTAAAAQAPYYQGQWPYPAASAAAQVGFEVLERRENDVVCFFRCKSIVVYVR